MQTNRPNNSRQPLLIRWRATRPPLINAHPALVDAVTDQQERLQSFYGVGL
jgi:hypothetical protein